MEPTLKQLRYLITVGQAGSFRGASERLDMSQPTLTAQINTLEDKLGINLLERSRQGATFTPFARSILPNIEAILKEVATIKRLAVEAEDSAVGTYRLGVPPTLGPYFLPEVIPAIHKAFPALKIYVKEKEPRDLEVGLLHGEYDVIITTLPTEIPNLSIDPLFNEPLELVCALDHPFNEQEKVVADDLKGENLLAIEEKHRLFDLMQSISARYGAKLLRDYEGTSLDTLRHMIGTGMGIAFLPSLYVKSEIGPRRDVTAIDFVGDTFKRGVVLAWQKGSTRTELFKQLATLMRKITLENLSDHVSMDVQVKDIDAGHI